MNEKIKEFILANRVLTLGLNVENKPYCANLFYIFDEEELALLFISHPNSKHIKENDFVSVAIYSLNPIKGIQAQARLNIATKRQKKLFLSKEKKANFALGYEIYSLSLDYIKYTDNTLLLAKKIEFKR
ncbi:hypothetical protein [Campylobacter canadensis]|uniref:Pyridoxamine 5'-phosphate oxidase putative domain-containing protein n=1 Tax=Campylobacter canadensis TaxID=449520 RepID=A0ABS7WRS1_9BACT|nr:hypothetical protein [Campylobacter canadensis]MBZ7986705.1 hypothetical protein [Campylobacter canadensis]MBZ7994601.1 hypothetical protein [Campylobacter canadensis]MBZ7996839.1 hypothetical protein [Campylobacter canadensis]MBZ7997741.1 hypothetical protein [Campylobacter canadensis]MBZ7999932.1 hypothetical protein [Campylobacter canadensis]